MRPDNFPHVSDGVIVRKRLNLGEAAAVHGSRCVGQNSAINFTVVLREHSLGYGPFYGVRCHAVPCF